MQFVHLEAKNFKSFEHFSVSLEHQGVVKIDGINNTDQHSKSVGSGKSTIADALSYVLTGETVKGNTSIADVKNLYTKGDCEVSVTFIEKDKEYKVVRGERELSIFESGVDISKHLKRDTQQLILEKFPFFTPTFLGAAVIIGQNMPNSFTNNKPSARKQILEELTNSSFMIEEIKSMLSERKGDWQSEISDLTTEQVRLETQITASRTSILRANESLSALPTTESVTAELSQVESELAVKDSELATHSTAYDALVLSRKDLELSVSEATAELSLAREQHSEAVLKGVEQLLGKKGEADKEVSRLQMEFDSIGRDHSRLHDEVMRLKNAPTHCPTCKQSLPDAHKIDTTEQETQLAALGGTRVELAKSLDTARANASAVETEISTYKEQNKTNATIEGLMHKQSDLSSKLYLKKSEIDEAVVKSKSIQSEIDRLKTRLSDLRYHLKEADALRTRYQQDIARSEAEIVEFEKSHSEIDKTVESKSARLGVLNQVISFATRDFRTILLSSIIKRLDAYAKSYCLKMLDTNEIEFKDDGNNISITFRGRDFGVLSGGESQIVKMCITLALKRTLEDLVGFSSNLIFFDEILDNTDSLTAQQLVNLIMDLDIGSIFFISHHEDVYLPIDKTWLVTKTDNISVLEI